MRRREFITLLGGAAVAWPLAASAQQPAMPVIGFLERQSANSSSSADSLRAFRWGLKETGHVEGESIAIVYRWAENQIDRLPELAADLVRRNSEIDAAFAAVARERPDALLVTSHPFFLDRRTQLTHLASRHVVPAMFGLPEYVEAGGLMSYGARVSDAFRQLGVYAGRILKGAKPADLPVVQSTKFELVINAQTARTLGLQVPSALLARADEVIE